MSARLKGFIFGAVISIITPALALQGAPKPAGEAEAQAAADSATLPYFRLTYEDAEAAIGQALAERGAATKVHASITNRDGDNIFSYSQPISVEIRGLKFDAATHRFTTNLVSVSGKDVISVRAINGRYDEMVEVPVLKNSARAGEVIAQDNIEIRDYPKARTRSDTVTDMASLVGKSPQRVISSGRPIRSTELEEAAVVKKNDMVKMVFNQGAMQISTMGQAMTDGGAGSVISVRNMASKKIVQATVKDASTVLIDNGETRTSSLTVSNIYEN